MPDASRHCKRPALELGARWPNEALRGHPTTGFWRRTPDDLERSVARPSVQERRKAKLKPGKPTSTGPRAKTYALPRRGRGCDSWKAKTRPTTAMDASRPLAAVSRSIGFRDHGRRSSMRGLCA